jgi:hypothetical protein
MMTREQFALLQRRIAVEISWLRTVRIELDAVKHHDVPYGKALEEALDKLDALHRST